METLQYKADEIAGRKVDVEQTKDGSYIVMYMDFNSSPPTPGKTKEEALHNFIVQHKGKLS